MATWSTPIYDRTSQDVAIAKSKIAEWIADPSLPRYELKGCLNFTDLQRICRNIKYLSDRLNELYYRNSTGNVPFWNIGRIPTVTDVEKILNDVISLTKAYPTRENAPTVPDTMLTFDDINTIEELLQIIFDNISLMEKSFKKCGTIQCNSKSILPLRR